MVHVPAVGPKPRREVENDDEIGPRFPDMTEAYDKEYIIKLETAAKAENIRLDRGVYIAFSGPSFETPAEIRMAKTLGADLVGMSTVHETIAARAAGAEVLGVSLVTNLAAGMTGQPLSHDEVLEAGRQSAARMGALLAAVIAAL